jgi:hypothetical protein
VSEKLAKSLSGKVERVGEIPHRLILTGGLMADPIVEKVDLEPIAEMKAKEPR